MKKINYLRILLLLPIETRHSKNFLSRFLSSNKCFSLQMHEEQGLRPQLHAAHLLEVFNILNMFKDVNVNFCFCSTNSSAVIS